MFLSFRGVIAAVSSLPQRTKHLGFPVIFSFLQTGGCYLTLVPSSSPALSTWTRQLPDGV